MMMKNRTALTRRLLWPLATALLANAALAQQTAPKARDDVIVLSPFVVESSDEEGYVATQSLAGTRAKADLRDIAASISVMTPELLEDIGANDLQDALKYSVSTENEFEFAPNDTEGDSTSTLIQTRTRGLVSASTSRNFFTSRVRTDGYNTERLTLARGPNSVLFGLGSPAGVIDGTLTRARDSKKPFGSVSLQVDSYSGQRVTADLNVPLLKKYLSVRVSYLDQEKKTFSEPEVDDETRKYVTFTSRPWKGATLRGYYEGANINRVLGRQQLAYDYVSDWIAEGRPLYDYSTAKWTYDNGSTWGTWRGVNGYPEPLISNNKNPVYIVDGGAPFDSSVWDSVSLATNRETWRTAWKQQGTQALNFARIPESWNTSLPLKTFTDGSIVPLDVNLNGANSSTDFKVRTYAATFEQQITDKFFIELAYNREIFENNFFDSFRGSNIYADVSYYLPITQPLGTGIVWNTGNRGFVKDANNKFILIDNPNRGQFYNESATIGRSQELRSDTYRATASYELNLSKKNRWLGRYNLAAMYQHDRYEDLRIKTRLYTVGDYRNYGTPQHGNNYITNRAYINLPGVSPATDAPAYPGPYLDPADNGLDWWTTYLGGIHDDGRPELGAREVETMMGVMQAYWPGPFADSLVGTFGYRRDKVDIYDSTGNYRSSGIWQLDKLALDDEPSLSLSGITRTLGVVYHSPVNWLSAFYNKSDNFNPHTNKKNVFGELLDRQTGSGEEYGFLIEAFNRKLTLRVNAYRNSVQGGLENNYYFNSVKDNVITYVETAIRNYINQEAIATYNPVPDAQGDFSDADQALLDAYADNHPDTFRNWSAWNNQVTLTRDYTSKGYEAEVFARPMKGLDVRLTVAKSESVNNHAFPVMQAFVEQRMPVWEKYYDHNATVTPLPGAILPDWQTNSASLGWRLFNNANRYPRYYEGVSGEGLPSQLNRKWRANLIVNYAFQDKSLRGLSTGFGTRWRQKAAIGFLPMPSTFLDGTTMPDLSKPVYGEDQLFFDVWFKYRKKFRAIDWTLYFKIENPFENGPKVVPYEASYQLDGAITKWQVEADRRFVISSKFSF